MKAICAISGKALRGKDGSMDEAVDGMSKERPLIFTLFAVGLIGNLCTVLSTCFILMDFPVSIIAVIIVLYAAWIITSNSLRIQKKFVLTEAVRLDDLTQFTTWGNSLTSIASRVYIGGKTEKNDNDTNKIETVSLLGNRSRKSANELV